MQKWEAGEKRCMEVNTNRQESDLHFDAFWIFFNSFFLFQNTLSKINL